MALKFVSRNLLVLFLLVLSALAFARLGMAAAEWSAVRERLGLGGSLNVQYPTADCGKNDFLYLRLDRGPETQECLPVRIWSDDCVRYWLRRYELRDTGASAAALEAEARGIPYGGSANLIDEVFKDLIDGVIRCP